MPNCSDRFDQSNCLEFSDTRREFVCKDHKEKRKYIGRNPNRNTICKFQVDKCLIPHSAQEQADYLVINNTIRVAYLIELKGSDLRKAISQLDTTLSTLLPKLGDCQINARVVLSKVPTTHLNSSDYIRFKKRIKRLRGTLKQQSRQMTETL